MVYEGPEFAVVSKDCVYTIHSDSNNIGRSAFIFTEEETCPQKYLTDEKVIGLKVDAMMWNPSLIKWKWQPQKTWFNAQDTVYEFKTTKKHARIMSSVYPKE